jgi:hypothetical protein
MCDYINDSILSVKNKKTFSAITTPMIIFSILLIRCKGMGLEIPQDGNSMYMLTDNEKILVDFSNVYHTLTYDEKIEYILHGGVTGGGGGGVEQFYLGYLLRDMAFVFHITNKNNIKNVILDIFEIYKKEFIYNGKFKSPRMAGELDHWNRDAFARDMRLLYEAYDYIQSKEILTFIEQQAVLWMSLVPRSPVGEYLIYPYGVKEETGLPVSYEIDPNQNLCIALLFSYLYWEEASTFYLNDGLKDIVYNEVNAVISLQKYNGSLPLREGRSLVEDTNYGGLCGEYLYRLAQIWGEKEWIEADKKIGIWLFSEWPMAHPWNTPEDYPNFSSKKYEMYNLIGRITSFYAAGIEKDYILSWIEFAKSRFPDIDPLLLSRGYFDRSIPRDYFGIYVNNKLPPVINIQSSERSIKIIIIASCVNQILTKIIGKKQMEYSLNIQNNDIQDRNDSFNLENGSYLMECTVLSDNGKTKIKTLPIYVTNGNIQIEYMIFDKNNPMSEK